MSISISKLISEVGDENVKIQSLDNCMISATYGHKKGTVISFGTDQPLLPDGTKELGMIVWLPRDKVKKIMEPQKDQAHDHHQE